MTDEINLTYGELEADLLVAREENKRLRKTSDDNYANGQAWKKQAEELVKQVDHANRAADKARTEAAELRGYIRRVNELDPKRVQRQKRIEHTGPHGVPMVKW